MIVQVLAPTVKNRDEADLRTEVFWVGGNRAQRLGNRLEQDGVERRLVLEGDGCNRRGQCEDDMVIGHRQQVLPPRLQPVPAGLSLTLRAMPVAAGIVGDYGGKTRRRSARRTGTPARGRRVRRFGTSRSRSCANPNES